MNREKGVVMRKRCFLISVILAFTAFKIPGYAVSVSLSPGEKAVQNAVIVDIDASVILVNGAKRYIDMEDTAEKPEIINGSIYLPVHTLARALGYYYEYDNKSGYLLLRREGKEFVFDTGSAYCSDGRGTSEDILNRLVFKNGEPFLPLRSMAEAVGMTVAFSDGIAAVSDTDPQNNILGSALAKSYIKSQLEPFSKEQIKGRTYYVASGDNASDDNLGTLASPFRTISRAGEVAKPGDTVIIREGIYRETFCPEKSGRPDAPITYKAYDGEKVVISAAEEITEFTQEQDGLLKAELPADLGLGKNQIFYRGEALAEGRYPNTPQMSVSDTETLSPLFPTEGDFEVSSTNPYQIKSDTLLRQSDGWWNGAVYVGLQGAGWTLSTGIVEKSERGKLLVTYTPEQWWFANSGNDSKSFGFLTCHIRCVDLPGEWAEDNGDLYIMPPKGETEQSLVIEAKARQLAVDLRGKNYIRLQGIDIFGGGVSMADSSMCVIDDSEMKYISHYIHGKDQREGYIDDGNIQNPDGAPQRGEMGVYISGDNNAVINCIIDHSAAAGIYSTGKYAYIENNVIKNCGYAGSYVSGITFGTEGWKSQTTPRGGFSLYHNTVYNCGRSALNMQGRQYWEDGSDTPYLPFEAAYNDFHDGILFSLDTGIVYEYYVHAGLDGINSRFHNNYIYYTADKTNPYSFGIYHDGNTSGIDTYENLVFTSSDGVKFSNAYIYRQPEADCNIWNNMEIKGGVPGARAGLLESDFPFGKPFFAGSYLKDGDYSEYCEKFMTEHIIPDYYPAKNAVLSGAQADENGLVQIQTGGFIRFDNVDFGSGANHINIDFCGNSQKAADCVSVIIGDSIEEGIKYNTRLLSGAADLEKNDIARVDTKTFSGKNTVFIRMDRRVSAKVSGISVNGRGNFTESHDGSRIYAGEYSNIEKIGNESHIPTPIYSVSGDTSHPMVKNTYGGTILRYDNVNIGAAASRMEIQAASEGESSGGIVKFRIGSNTAPAIAEYTIPDSGWDNYKKIEFELTNLLPAGIYDIYVEFSGADKTSNFYTFGFLP